MNHMSHVSEEMIREFPEICKKDGKEISWEEATE